jgi:hypothetical protein
MNIVGMEAWSDPYIHQNMRKRNMMKYEKYSAVPLNLRPITPYDTILVLVLTFQTAA